MSHMSHRRFVAPSDGVRRPHCRCIQTLSIETMLRRLCTPRITEALGVRPGRWSQALLISARSSSTSHDGQDKSVVESLAQAASHKDLEGLLSIVETAGESFKDGQTVVEALRQVEACTRDMAREEVQQKLHGTKTFQMLADMAVSSAGHAPPEVLAGTIGALGRLGFQDEMVLDSLARHLMPGVQHLKPEHITELVEGLKRADHSPSVLLLDEVHERLAKMQQSVPQEQSRAVEEGLRDLGREDDNPPNEGAQAQPDRIKYS